MDCSALPHGLMAGLCGRLRRRSRSAALAAALVLAPFAGGQAQGLATGGAGAALDQAARVFLSEQLRGQSQAASGPLALRPEVVLGQLDPRLQLAPCARIEPYLPSGAALWGRSRVGLRCVEGPVAWNVFLPLTVKAWGPGWVLRRTVPANSPITVEDVQWVPEVDWAEQRSPVLADQEQWLGQLAAFTLLPGQVLRAQHVRPPQAFGAGSPVRVVVAGAGFELSASGQALTAGVVGQSARVKLDSGKVVTGTVRQGGVVELSVL